MVCRPPARGQLRPRRHTTQMSLQHRADEHDRLSLQRSQQQRRPTTYPVRESPTLQQPADLGVGSPDNTGCPVDTLATAGAGTLAASNTRSTSMRAWTAHPRPRRYSTSGSAATATTEPPTPASCSAGNTPPSTTPPPRTGSALVATCPFDTALQVQWVGAERLIPVREAAPANSAGCDPSAA